jgi:hypothetical protein
MDINETKWNIRKVERHPARISVRNTKQLRENTGDHKEGKIIEDHRKDMISESAQLSANKNGVDVAESFDNLKSEIDNLENNIKKIISDRKDHS